MRPWQFQMFNLFFIVLYQNALLVLITLPAWTAYQHRSTSFGALDYLLTMLFLVFTLGETVADQQQWNFHQWKKAEVAAGRTPNPQFLQRGLFQYSRHPNYFFELAQWWVVLLFGVVAAQSVLEWTILGPILLTLLFVGSTRFTEKISLSHYPEYALFQRSTSAVIPWFARSVTVVQVSDAAQ
jgi:steroid 5-alpha reductase family enzyme